MFLVFRSVKVSFLFRDGNLRFRVFGSSILVHFFSVSEIKYKLNDFQILEILSLPFKHMSQRNVAQLIDDNIFRYYVLRKKIENYKNTYI